MNKLLAMFLLFICGQIVITLIFVAANISAGNATVWTMTNTLGWVAYTIVWILAIKFLYDEYLVVRKRKEAKQ